jgi:hypothetical protein
MVLVGIGLGLAGVGGGEGTPAHPATADISISACFASQSGIPTAQGTIVNHSSEPSDYEFRLDFIDPTGRKITDDGGNTVRDLQPGGTESFSTEGLSRAPSGPITCKVGSIHRYRAGTMPLG